MQSEDSSSVDGDNDQDSDQDNDQEIEDSEDEFRKDIPGDVLDQGISSPPPLPTPERKHSKLHFVTSLLQWLLYFLFIWQGICHISDNGLAWL